MIVRRLAALVTLLGATSVATPAQQPARGAPMQVQPKIMVIPFVKAGEDLRTVLEADFNRRIAITKVKEGFDNHGFSTVDFRQVLNSLADDQVIQSTSQSDIKTRVIEQARCDIYVEVELQTMTEGQNQRVSMITTSYLAANAASLANKSVTVGPYHGVPMEMIVERAATDKLEPFLATMQEKFDDFVSNGVPIRVEVSVAEGAQNLTRAVGPNKDELGDAIEEWLASNAVGGNYHVSGRTDLMLKADEVRIQLVDPATKANFNPSRFSLELVRYLRTLGVRASRSLAGGTIYVEIQ